MREGPRPTKPPTPSIEAPLVNLADPEKPRQRPGPKPQKTEAAKRAMMGDIEKKRLTLDDLRDMKQESLAAMYGVSREIAVNAREAVLSSYGDRVGIGNSDKK
jgi:hypothetical protein